MTSETKFKVRIDGRQAKSELQSIVREGARAAGRVSSGIRSTISKGFGLVGVGAALGAGMSAVRGATEGGIGDVVGESLGGLGAQAAQFFLGDLDEKARGSKAAREETIAAFEQFGAKAAQSSGAKQFYNSIVGLRTEAAAGREGIERSPDFRADATAGDIADRLLSGIATGFLNVINFLTGDSTAKGGR